MMMGILRVIFCVLMYFIIGKLFINIYCAILEEECDEDDLIGLTLFWPIVAVGVLLHLFWIVISFAGNRLSVIPIALIKVIQTKIKGRK